MMDVLDRVLDRGIVIDAAVSVHVVGLNLVGVEARIVVSCIETYLEYVDDVASTAPASWSEHDRDAEVSSGESAHEGGAVHNRIRPLLDEAHDPKIWRPE